MGKIIEVPIYEYSRPGGCHGESVLRIPQESQYKIEAILGAGFWFTIESKPSGQLFITVSDDQQDLMEELCDNNDSAVNSAIQTLIDNSYQRLLQ